MARRTRQRGNPKPARPAGGAALSRSIDKPPPVTVDPDPRRVTVTVENLYALTVDGYPRLRGHWTKLPVGIDALTGVEA